MLRHSESLPSRASDGAVVSVVCDGLALPTPAAERSGARRRACVDEHEAAWLAGQLGRPVGAEHRVLRHLASGGMGHAFLAEHLVHGRRAVVKVPRSASVESRAQLQAEAQLLLELDHPNIVRALETGARSDGQPYLLMEHVGGVDLDGWLDLYGVMSPPQALGVLKQVAAAVDHCHARGVVHGDIKPANVLLDGCAQPRATLIDFGVACRGSSPGRRGLVGTPAYMAPEQALGEPWGKPSDVYALAALALEILTGKPPHAAPTAQAVLTALLTEAPPAPSERGLDMLGLDAVFERGLHADPAQRFQTAGAFVAALATVLDAASRQQTRTQTGALPASLRLLRRWGGRRLAAALLVAGYAVAACVGV